MIPFAAYAVAAFATGWQLSQQILMGVWGKPSNPFEYWAFLGSLLLLVSAYVSLYSPRRAAWAVLESIVPLWIFYVPATVNAIQGLIQQRYVFEPFTFLPLLLLVTASAHSTTAVVRGLKRKSANIVFPETGSQKLRWGVFSVTGLSLLSLLIVYTFFVGIEQEQTTAVDWSIDDERGRSIAKFKFRQLSGFDQIETDSEEVLEYLRQNQPHDLSVRVILTYDFGKVRALNLNDAYLGPIRFRPYVEREP